MTKKVFIPIILLFFFNLGKTFSQTNTGLICGKVMDESAPIAFANVVIKTTDSVIVLGTITTQTGEFLLQHIPFGRKLIQISFLGYKTKIIETDIDSLENDVGIILLEPDALSLKEVIVKASLPVFTLKEGNLITNVGTSLLSSVGNANDVIGKIPGVTLIHGAINVFGKGTPIIYINNRRVREERELERLQSTDIKTVELITNPGAKYDAEGKAVLIINTKEKKSNGVSLQISEQLKQGSYLSNTENIDLSYVHNNLNVFASYSHTRQKNNTDEDEVYTIHADTIWKQTMHSPYTFRVSANIVTTGFDWSITEKHAIGVQYQGKFASTKSKSNGTEETQVLADGVIYDDITSMPSIKDKPYQHFVNAFYIGRYSDAFNIQFDFDMVKNHTETLQNTNEVSSTTGNRIIETNSQSDFDLYAGKLIANYNSKQIGNFEFGGEYNQIDGSGFFYTEGYTNNNIYTNKEKKAAVFISYKQTFDHLDLKAGIRYEYVDELSTEDSIGTITVNRKYNDFYPSISLSWKTGKTQMSLNANRRTKRPSFTELNNNNVYINSYLTQKGNPYLQKEDIYEINYRMMYKFFNLSLAYTYINNPISFSIESSGRSSAKSIFSFINYSKYQNINALASINYKFVFWQPQLTAGIIQPFFVADYNGKKIKRNKTDFSVGFYNDFIMPHDYIFSLNFNYQSDYESYIYQWGGYNRLNMGLRKSFFNKSFMVNLQAQDIFNWVKEKNVKRFDIYHFDQNKKRETQYITLTLRYLFNNYGKKYRGKNAASDDINRL